MNKSDFFYDLPEELIAQTPLADRSSSRLMVLDKVTGEVQHRHFCDILEYLDTHQADHITLDSLAKRFNVSASHLNRTFNRAFHTSPINYLIDARVTFATEYLLKSNYSVAKIAELCGYDNPAHFTNMFTKRIGCTPAEYRERNQKPPEDPYTDSSRQDPPDQDG